MFPFHLRAFKARPVPEAAAAFALRTARLLLPDAAAEAGQPGETLPGGELWLLLLLLPLREWKNGLLPRFCLRPEGNRHWGLIDGLSKGGVYR